MLACAQGYDNVINVILQEIPIISNNGMTCLMYAAASGKPDMIDLILSTNPKLIGKTDSNGYCSLRHAFKAFDYVDASKADNKFADYLENCRQCVRILMQYEFDVQSTDNVTTLMLCARYGFVEFIE